MVNFQFFNKLLSTSTCLLLLFSKRVYSETQLVPSSCTDLEDGEQFLKLLDGDDYPLVKVQCSNGYAMLDYSLDEDISSYFTSFLKWHYTIAGPSQTDHVNLEEWYLADDSNTKYLVSDSCDVCDESVQEFSSSGYYMNANLFGCFVYPRGMPDCDFDIDTYECHACYSEVGFGTIYQTEFGAEDATDSGACLTTVRESYAEVDRSFDECTYQTDNGYKPTIGTDGRFCICVQSSTTQFFTVDTSVIEAKIKTLDERIEEKTLTAGKNKNAQAEGTDFQTIYIYSDDFSKGTYRIRQPGIYIIMEDIEFDFNAGSIEDDPNSYGSWWPEENNSDYPGWGDTREEYFMGYFAGITIECNNVILDLNGFTLKQSKAFFYQQGFFSNIEVESQPFMPGQGVGFFGSNPIFPENVVIKNGYLGRTSHHCIHGNYNKNLLIEDIVCSEFSTHGIQLNGFNGVVLRNVEVGPSNNEQYLASEYTHYRFVLERMRTTVEEENPTDKIQFVNRKPVSLDELREKLQNELNYAFKYVMLGEEGDEDDEEWIEAKKTFISSSGYGYGASIYGIFLSYPGANVLTYHINSKISNTATLENVYIHDISHSTKEYIGIRTDLRMFVNSFNAPLHIKYLLGDEVYTKMEARKTNSFFDYNYEYVGNILTDSTLAMHQLSNSWGRLQIMYLLEDELVAWAKGGNAHASLGDQVAYLCAVDGMIHAVKGTFGLRIDGVDSVSIDSMIIENIAEHSELGTNICGSCSKCAFEGRLPYLIGYAGNMAQGISADYATNLKIKDLTIRNVESKTGRAIGFNVWPGTSVTFEGEINVENINAGTEVNSEELTYDTRPNVAPEACGIRVYTQDAYDDTHDDIDFAVVTLSDDVSINTKCVSGSATCWNLENTYSQIGDYENCDSTSTSSSSHNSKKLIDVSSRIRTKHKINNYNYNFIIEILLITSISIGIIFYLYKSCSKNNKVSILKADYERLPLTDYGSIQN